MKKLINFDEMLAPKFIKFFYWLGIAFFVSYGLLIISGGFVFGNQIGMRIIVGSFILIMGPMMVRIGSELLYIPFKIYEEIKKKR